MDTELKEYLSAMEARMEARMDARFEATEKRMEARIEASAERMEARMDRMEVRIESKMDELENRMKDHVSEKCEAVETRLLSEFWKWGRTSDIRTRQVMSDVSMLGERMLALEDRVTALEFNRRPGAAA